MPDLPAHASPMITPLHSPLARPSSQYLSHWQENDGTPQTPSLPNNLLSPAFTPPSTPGAGTPSRHLYAEPKSTPVDTSLLDPSVKQPRLLERLPQVECLVRARIPTTSGAEMFLHLYQNDSDNKEHLAIVFGNTIRSRSLDAERPGETEMDRMIRGAYVGRLRPGRVSSRVDGEVDLRKKMALKRRERSGSALKNMQSATGEDSGPRETESSTPTSHPSPLRQRDQAEEQPETPRQQYVDSTTSSSSAQPPQLQDSPVLSPSSQHQPKAPLVRIHSECYTGETAWSARCDCGEQLDEAARLMSLPTSTGGVIVYLRQEGRGIGLASKLKAYNLQDLGSDTVEANLLLRHPADARSYGLATAILVDLGLGTEIEDKEEEAAAATATSSDDPTPAPISHESKYQPDQGPGIRLLTNNPEKVWAVEGPNREVRVCERVAMVPLAWRTAGKKGVQGIEIERYLETKIGRMGHRIYEE